MAAVGRKLPRSSPTLWSSWIHWQSTTSVLRPGTFLTRVDEHDVEAAPLENLEERNPVHAGGFHSREVTEPTCPARGAPLVAELRRGIGDVERGMARQGYDL